MRLRPPQASQFNNSSRRPLCATEIFSYNATSQEYLLLYFALHTQLRTLRSRFQIRTAFDLGLPKMLRAVSVWWQRTWKVSSFWAPTQSRELAHMVFESRTLFLARFGGGRLLINDKIGQNWWRRRQSLLTWLISSICQTEKDVSSLKLHSKGTHNVQVVKG